MPSNAPFVRSTSNDGTNFRRYFGLLCLLERLLPCEIDLLTRNEIRPHARESIERDLIPVL
ncbi:hypothetical protein FJZ36_10895 [Candidatus Poribacteria bacterium]|nr:hypothetical protein [Candidatus Poribacteria bacterium]